MLFKSIAVLMVSTATASHQYNPLNWDWSFYGVRRAVRSAARDVSWTAHYAARDVSWAASYYANEIQNLPRNIRPELNYRKQQAKRAWGGFNREVDNWSNMTKDFTKKAEKAAEMHQKKTTAMLNDINNVVDKVEASNYQEKVEKRVQAAGEKMQGAMDKIREEGSEVIQGADKFRNNLAEKAGEAERAINETRRKVELTVGNVLRAIPDERDIYRAVGNLQRKYQEAGNEEWPQP